MRRIASPQHSMVPTTFTASRCARSAGFCESMRALAPMMPALLTSPTNVPSARSASTNIGGMALASAMSARIAWACPPPARISATIASAASRLAV